MTGLLKAGKIFFKNRPLIANSVIYGSLYVSAEFSQQILTKKILTEQRSKIDVPILGRYAVLGTLVFSPMLFYWYKWLDKTLPGTAKNIIVKKLLLDQFLFTPPLLLIFFIGMSLMERVHDPFKECKEKFTPTFARSCLFWLPAQTINFTLIKSQYRVVYVGACALIWVNILCWIKRQKLKN